MSTQGPQTEQEKREQQEKRARLKKRALTEFFETEDTYHRALVDFGVRTEAYSKVKEQRGQIAKMEAMSGLLCKVAEKTPSVSDLIANLQSVLSEDQVKIYENYMVNFDDYNSQLMKVDKTQAKNLPTLSSLAIQPVQRIPRYLLLLKEMRKNTEENSPDAALLDKEILRVDAIAKKINEAKRTAEARDDLKQFLEKTPSKFLGSEIRAAIKKDIKNKQTAGEINVIHEYANNLKKLQENKPGILHWADRAAYQELIGHVRGLLLNNRLRSDPNNDPNMQIIEKLNTLSPDSTAEEIQAVSKAIVDIRVQFGGTIPPKPSTLPKLERMEAVKQLPVPPSDILAKRREKSDHKPILSEYEIDTHKQEKTPEKAGKKTAEDKAPPLPPRPRPKGQGGGPGGHAG